MRRIIFAAALVGLATAAIAAELIGGNGIIQIDPKGDLDLISRIGSGSAAVSPPTGCSNSFDLSQACNSQYLGVTFR